MTKKEELYEHYWKTTENRTKNRGLTQSEMCQPILSTSYYAKVEKGYHKIAAEDLLSILKQNKIDVIDFYFT